MAIVVTQLNTAELDVTFYTEIVWTKDKLDSVGTGLDHVQIIYVVVDMDIVGLLAFIVVMAVKSYMEDAIKNKCVFFK